MNLTYYGHACFLVEILGKHLLFDPFITPNPQAQRINIKTIPADYILVTHGHEDHIADAIKIARHTKAVVIANFETAAWLKKKGASNTRALNPGGSADFDFGQVKFVNAVHSSSLPNGIYGGCPGGFVVTSTEGNFYYSGDTALTMDMKLIGEQTKLNFAALCIGGGLTMGVDDAVRAAKFINCSTIFGVHYDTFPEIMIDHVKADEKFRAAGIALRLLEIGASISL